MNRARPWGRAFRHPAMVTVTALVGLLGAAAWWGRSWRILDEARKRWTVRSELRVTLLRTDPAPTAQGEAELIRVRRELDQTVADRSARIWTARDDSVRLAGAAPVRERAGAFFDLAWFVEEMRATAAERNVMLAPGEHFGFSAYLQHAPVPDQVERVLRQRQQMEHLLTALFDAGPARLESVRREGAQPGRGASRTSDLPGTVDQFRLEPAISLRRNRKVDTLGFRLVFAGETECLRQFIARVSAAPTPWVIRLVEAEPADAPGGRAPAASAPEPSPVQPQLTRFAVTLESVEGWRDESGLPAANS